MATDPETYLRLASERDLLAADPRRGMRDDFEGVIIGRALIATGGLTKETARSVLDEYLCAQVLRGQQNGHIMLRGHAPPLLPKQQLRAQRVVVGALDFTHGTEPWRLEKVLFTDDAVELHLAGAVHLPVGWGGGAGPGRRPMVHGRPSQPFPQTVALADDRGSTATGHVWGGSSWGGGGWRTHYRSDRPLSPDTEWMEIDGVRVVLPERRPVPPARVEPIEPLDPVRAVLMGEILSTDRVHGDRDSFEIAARALVSTGIVDDADAALEEMRRIWRALADGTAAPGLPAPWDRLMARFGKADGLTGTVAIGTTIEELEGHAIRFDALTTDEGSFTLHVSVSPGTPLLRHFPGMDLDLAPLTWWAQDDRGNHYVAFFSQGGGGPTAEGEVRSLAPLDPRASVLTLLPTTAGARGVVAVPLEGLRR